MNKNSYAYPSSPDGYKIEFGLTKREWFAAKAMEGILSDPMAAGEVEHVARLAVLHADALIAELSKEPVTEGRGYSSLLTAELLNRISGEEEKLQ
jgi:hypothetical protein